MTSNHNNKNGHPFALRLRLRLRLLRPFKCSGSQDCLGDHPQHFRIGVAAEQHAIDVPLFPRILLSL
jgi:hypothetical protein